MPAAKTWLVDSYLNTKREINLQDTTLYNFAYNSDTLSYRNRFMLVFNRQFVAKPIPVKKVINQNNPNISGIANSGVKASSVTIYPNPVSDDKVMLHFINMVKGVYDITVYNSQAQKIVNASYTHAGGDDTYDLLLNPAFAQGVCNVVIVNNNSKETFNLKLEISR